MEDEVAQLRSVVDAFGYGEREALQVELARLRDEVAAMQSSLAQHQDELSSISTELVTTREELILQEVGVYDYHHRLEDAASYKVALDQVRTGIKTMSKKDGGAVTGHTNWTVEGSAQKGRKMVTDISKLLLRAYNGEADVQVNKMRPYKLEAAVDRLNKSRATVTKLGTTMGITISEQYHLLRIQELRLTADYLARKEAEKEAEREERERLREEAKARRELEEHKAKLFKEQAHYQTAIARLRETGTPDEIAEAERTLAELEEAIHGVEERAANIRAGYVYVISNFGAFGSGVVKIGMTRRLEPMDRVRELGDASVPFRYDVHAVVFSNDAVSLETALHQRFASQRVNLVNLRREFFFVTPKEVEAALQDLEGSLLEFVEEPEADEWHQSENARKNR